jgi:hypothetical protein
MREYVRATRCSRSDQAVALRSIEWYKKTKVGEPKRSRRRSRCAGGLSEEKLEENSYASSKAYVQARTSGRSSEHGTVEESVVFHLLRK